MFDFLFGNNWNDDDFGRDGVHDACGAAALGGMDGKVLPGRWQGVDAVVGG